MYKCVWGRGLFTLCQQHIEHNIYVLYHLIILTFLVFRISLQRVVGTPRIYNSECTCVSGTCCVYFRSCGFVWMNSLDCKNFKLNLTVTGNQNYHGPEAGSSNQRSHERDSHLLGPLPTNCCTHTNCQVRIVSRLEGHVD